MISRALLLSVLLGLLHSVLAFFPLRALVLPRESGTDARSRISAVCRGRAIRMGSSDTSKVPHNADFSEVPSLARVDKLNREVWDNRLKSLEQQAIADFQQAIRFHGSPGPVLTTALIAGDMVVLHILHKAGLLNEVVCADDHAHVLRDLTCARVMQVRVLMIDTFHLFDETHSFLERVENHYGFKAQVCRAQGCASREDFEEMYGDDLFISDVEKYDRVAKVEPLLRALRESATTLWINGRRRDQVTLSRRPPNYVPICAVSSCEGVHGRLGDPCLQRAKVFVRERLVGARH